MLLIIKIAIVKKNILYPNPFLLRNLDPANTVRGSNQNIFIPLTPRQCIKIN